jgi:outer membrane protein
MPPYLPRCFSGNHTGVRLCRAAPLLCVINCAFIAGLCVAQAQPRPLTLEDCIRLAQQAPSIATLARQERDIAGRGITQARASLLPLPQIGGAYNYNNPINGQPSFVALNAVHEYIAQVSVAQEFDTSGRLRADLVRARAEETAASASLAITQRDLKRAVTTAYYRALLTQRLVRVLEDVLTESQSFERRSRLLLDSGEAAQADLVKAALQSTTWAISVRNAQAEATLARQELAAFWTQDVTAPLELDDALEKAAPEEPPAEAAPYLRRLEFNWFDAQKKSFQAQERMARSALYPRTSFVFAYGIDAATDPANARGFAAFLNLNIPLFDWSKARSAAKQFQLRGEQVETNRSMAQRVLSKEYESARTRVRTYREQMPLLDRQARLAKQNLDLSRVRYEGGEGSALDVVTAQDSLAQALAGYYTNLANYWNARADLEVASGR